MSAAYYLQGWQFELTRQAARQSLSPRCDLEQRPVRWPRVASKCGNRGHGSAFMDPKFALLDTKWSEYWIGGYQVFQKWLAYRPLNLLGRALTASLRRPVKPEAAGDCAKHP